MAGPQLVPNKGILNTRCEIKKSFPLPGLRDHCGDTWRYRMGCDFSFRLGILPREWLHAFPAKSSAVLSAVPLPGDDGMNRYSTLTRGN